MRYGRRRFVQGAGALGLALLAGCGRLPGQAQQPAKVPRVGLLFTESVSAPGAEAFRQGLRDLGYVEGQNIAIAFRSVEGREARAPDLAAELVRLPVDILVAIGEPQIRAAREATGTIPIVMAGSNDPVGSGFVASLARPGGHVTGLSFLGAQLSGKRVELLKEVLPNISRVAALGPDTTVPQLQEAEVAARVLGVQLQFLEIRGAEGLERAFEAATSERADALVVLAASVNLSHRRRVAELAAERQLPAIAWDAQLAHAGLLMTYGPNVLDLWRRSASYVDKILKGAKPADLPVEQPREFEFVINLKTAQALGLTIPPHVLLQATEVIQ